MASNEQIMEYLKQIEQKLVGLTETNARLAQEIVAIKSGGTSVAESRSFNMGGTSNKPKGVVVTIDEEVIKVSGNTYKHRGIFAECGGVWKGEHKHWEIKSDERKNFRGSWNKKDFVHESKE